MLSRRLLLAAALLLPALARPGTYPMESGDLRRSSRALTPTALGLPLAKAWEVQSCFGEAMANPVVLDDRIVVTFRSGLVCHRRSDGAALWKLDLGTWLWNSVAYDADRDLLYLATFDGRLYALRPSDGAVQWNIDEGREDAGLSMAAPTYLNGRILFKNGRHDFVCVDADSRAVLWRYRLQHSKIGGTPSVDGGRVYLGGEGGDLACLNWADGSVVWERAEGAGRNYSSALVLDDVRVYTKCANGRVEGRRRSDGGLLWSYQMDSYSNGNMSLDQGRLFCTSDDRCIHALDPASGALLWRQCHLGNFARSSAFSCGGWVFASGCAGSYYGDNGAGGGADWSFAHGGGNSFNDFCEADGDLYVSNIAGKVFCFRTGCPGCTPTQSPTVSPSFTPSPALTDTPTLSFTPTHTTSVSASPSATPSASPTATVSATATPTATLTASPSASRTVTPTQSATVSATLTPSASPTATPSATPAGPPATATPLPGDAPGGLDDPGDHCYVYPNPTGGRRCHVVYRVHGPCQARVRVFQAAGEPACLVEQRHESAGVKSAEIPSEDFAPGIYIYKVDLKYDDGKRDKRPLGKFICTRN